MQDSQERYRTGFGRTTLIFASAYATVMLSAALAQSNPPVVGAAQLQYASITASGNTITATRIPVKTDKGTVYQDLTIQFDADAYGNLLVSSGFPAVTPSPNLLTPSFQTGIYHSASTVWTGKGLLELNGPGITAGGATAWTLSTTNGADGCTVPRNLIWYVGPPETSPIAARLKKANITSQLWSYGIAGGGSCPYQDAWSSNTLIGVSQIGNTITLATFSLNGSGTTDKPEPVDQLTFTLAK